MKVQSSYKNLLGGVSEQAPEARLEGQMSEQVNMLTDPLEGLVRRHGSRMMSSADLGPVTSEQWSTLSAAAPDYVVHSTSIESEWYDLIYRKRAEPGSPALPPQVQRHGANGSVSIVPTVPASADDAEELARGISAVATVGRYVLMAPAGKAPLFTRHAVPAARRKAGVAWVRGGTYARKYTLSFTAKSPAGATSRHTVEYKTNLGAYPQPLDTSDIPWASPDYSKFVTRRSSRYAAVQAAYVGWAADKIQPQYIASQLARLALIAIGLSTDAVTGIGGGAAIGPVVDPLKELTRTVEEHLVTMRVAGHVHPGTGQVCPQSGQIGPWGVAGATAPALYDCPVCGTQDINSEILARYTRPASEVYYQEPDAGSEDAFARGWVNGAGKRVPFGQPEQAQNLLLVQDGYLILPTADGDWQLYDVELSDDGTGDFVRVCQTDVRTLEELTPKHIVGSVVEIRPDKGAETSGLYMVAESTTGQAAGSFGDVSWKESTPEEIRPAYLWHIGTVHNGAFHYASTPAALAAATGLAVPEMLSRLTGDDSSSPMPAFAGKRVTYLGLFQDRLLVIAGNVLNFSRPGDYFNFFRSSALRVDDADPVEVYPTGSEGDSIYAAVPSGRNFLLFGDGYQYLLAGNQVLTPKNAGAVMQLSNFSNDADVVPVPSGNYTFYPSTGEFGTHLHEIPSAYLTESPETHSASQQLKRYIAGRVRQVAALTNPNLVLLLTDGNPGGLYLFRYEDQPGRAGHAVGAWSRWSWSPVLGHSLGIQVREGRVNIPFLRTAAGRLWLCVEQFSLDSRVSSRPYLDSLTPAGAVLPGQWHHSIAAELTSSWDDSSPYWLMHTEYAAGLTPADGQWVGIPFPSYVEPTNPMVRSQEGAARTTGTTTVGQIQVDCTRTGGAAVEVTDQYGEQSRIAAKREGTTAYTTAHASGERPVGDWSLKGYIGRSPDRFRFRIHALDVRPLNITGISWTGQYFTSGRRV